MKNLLIVFIFICFALTLSAQEFAPVGAEWYYGEQFAFSGDVDYIKFTSEKDTLVYGKNCRKITKRHKLSCNGRPNTEFMYKSNDTVFFYDKIFDEFQILYVANLKPEDSWIIKVRDEFEDIDTIVVTVDSIDVIEINGHNLNVLHVDYYKYDENQSDNRNSTIIDKIGDVYYLFNWYPYSALICDGNYTKGIRCYEDSEIGLYSTGIADSCDLNYFWTGIEGFTNDINIQVYPNPASDFVKIQIEGIPEFLTEIFDITGRLLFSEKSYDSNIRVDISSFKNGLYVISIKDKNQKLIGYRRLVKG